MSIRVMGAAIIGLMGMASAMGAEKRPQRLADVDPQAKPHGGNGLQERAEFLQEHIGK